MIDEAMRWKASQARGWAVCVMRAAIRIEQRNLALQEAIETFDGLRSVSVCSGSGQPMEHGDDRMAALINDMEEMREEWMTAMAEYRETVADFERCLRMLDGRDDALLTARFIRRLSWEQVADAIGYSPNYVRDELATIALASLYDVMPPSKRDQRYPAV